MALDCPTLVDLLHRRAEQQADKRLYTFVDHGGQEQGQLTFGQLDQRARSIAVLLQGYGLSKERVLLLFPPGLDFVAAFLGCLYAAAAAVPAYPPRPSGRGDSRLESIIRDCRPAAVLTSRALSERLLEAAPLAARGSLKLLNIEEAEAELADGWKRPAISGETLAFLQYTSGSTADPKGVMLSHSNLLRNEETIRRAFGQSRDSRVVSWLPLYHDMGLIGGVLQPLCVGSTCLLMAPLTFLQKPFRWLEAVSRFKADTSGGPNFAYDLCAHRIPDEEKKTLDLSSWRVAFNGAEPVRATTLERFSRAFAPCGFRPEAHFPCYGLAEATVFVSGGEVERPPRRLELDPAQLEEGRAQPASVGQENPRRLVSCGVSGAGHEVRVADAETGRSLPENEIGEIWIRGPSVADGYWDRPEETARSFQARLQDDPAGEPFLRSGDLGFLSGGELYVAGRLKDLIILRGRNLYPQDVERTVEEAHPALQPGAGAAFSVEIDDEERLVAVQELRRSKRRADLEEVREAMRRAVAEEYEVQLYDAVPVLPGRVPRTSSGKVRRSACRQEYMQRRQEAGGRGQEEEDSAEPPAYGLPPAAFLSRTAARVLKVGTVPSDRPLTGLGLDSLGAAELKQALDEALRTDVPLDLLLSGATLDGLEEEIGRQRDVPPQLQPSLQAGPPQEEFPLSDGQRALWFLQRLNPQRAADNIAAAVRLRGELDVDAFWRCWQALSERHPALRTAFPEQDGDPVQRVHERFPPDFQLHKAQALTPDDLQRRLESFAFQPFDLAKGPLLRLALWRRGSEEHWMALSVHHIVADFASLAVLFGELERLYRQETGQAPAELQPLPLAYSDYVQWQQQRLQGPQGDRLWDYWREKLSGTLPQLDLPADRPRPPLLPEEGSSRALQLGAELTGKLEDLSRSRSVTLYMTLLAAFQVLLCRSSGQTDLLVGTPASGRPDPRLAPLVGYFAGPAVLRTSLSGDPAFDDLLGRVRETVAGALQHEYPFIRLAERLQPARDPGRAPLFQVLFSFQNARRPEDRPLAAFALGESGACFRLASLQMESLAWRQRPVQFDLTLMTAQRQDGLSASLQYNTALFDGATAQRMLARLRSVLEAVTDCPARRLSRIPLLPPSERLQLVQEYNDTARPYPAGHCIHQLFEDRCRESPDRVALAAASEGVEQEALSFAELEARSAILAQSLRRSGVGAEVVVGVHLERSPGMVAAVLGVLRAGGAYLPLDPSFPAARLQMMLEDSGTQLLLSNDASLCPAVSQQRCPATGAELCSLLIPPSEPCRRPSLPDNLAYLIYTSGSTGRPKGVEVPHRGVVNFLASMARRPGLSDRDALLSVTTLSFDIAALELFLPLMCGARLVLADQRTIPDGALLEATLTHCGITAMQATPATWRLLPAAGWEGGTGLRALCGGEALPRRLADQILQRAESLCNLYGPTETTIWSAAERVEPDGDDGLVSIGRPIANTSIVLLDGGREPVPMGVAGELCIGGQGVVRGYFRRPGLTAERFIPDPCSGQPGLRLYRTGDLARRRSDGRLEFLGRMDHQVKVRGFRIELGEIETVLESHPGVRQAVAAAKDERLIGYFSVASCQSPAVSAEGDSKPVPLPEPVPESPSPPLLKAFLRERLPEYMVPSLFVELDEFPLTPNGKVDRKALPTPGSDRPQLEADFVAPRSRLEQQIAQVWKEVLQVDRVGLEDNFFDLGGHSLLLAKVHSRLRDRLGNGLAMLDLLQHPTVGALAGFLARQKVGTVPKKEGTVPIDSRKKLGTVTERLGTVPIAVIGMAGRFPGASDVGQLWERLCGGEECISFFSDQELIEEGLDPDMLRKPNYVKAAGVLDGAELFDAGFFGFTPREAELMDPQHRVFLECAWQALEDSGYDSLRYPGRIGVFAAVGINTYLQQSGLDSLQSPAARYQAFIGNDKDFVPTRVSYKLNLRGPSLNVQTACSSSLAAVHLACRSLMDAECEMALAGGVTVRFPQRSGHLYEQGGIPSPDGHCRAFDAQAQGTVFGNGAGIVVLKPLEQARRDRILAVVRGTAVNNDGSSKLGYTAPSAEGQAEVIRQAMQAAGTPPESITYLECHGTGTPLGDPIEVAALQQAFQSQGNPPRRCLLGSVKTNLGHLDTAAGVTGLIKTVLALQHAKIPASLHFEKPNPEIDFESGPFRVSTKLTEWKTEGPRRAGVSSFGIGGTNVHAVLEQAPAQEASGASRPWQLLLLSAKSKAALEEMGRGLAGAIREREEGEGKEWLADAAFTLQVGRRALEERQIVLAQDEEQAAALLEKPDGERVFSAKAPQQRPAVAFLFPGQGAQYPAMARQLYETEPLFREVFDRCSGILSGHLEADLHEAVFGELRHRDIEDTERKSASLLPASRLPSPDSLSATSLAQPALFAVEYSLAKLWMSWGVEPEAMLGHSLGEYVAACLAGVFSLQDALALVAARGRLMQSLPAGAMLGLDLPEDQALTLIAEPLALAAVNAPNSCVVSGPTEAIEELEERLKGQALPSRRLHTSHAFHSAMMDPILEEFTALLARTARREPRRPWISNRTGGWVTAEQAVDPPYWTQQLRRTVRFGQGVKELLRREELILLEVGPGHTLSTLVRRQAAGRTVLNSMRHPNDPQPDSAVLLRCLGRLWLAGAEIDWTAFSAHEKRRRVALPTYPFQRQEHFLKARRKALPSQEGLQSDLSRWFHLPVWQQSPRPQPMAAQEQLWLIFEDQTGVAQKLAQLLQKQSQQTVAIEWGQVFQRLSERRFAIDPARLEDYLQLLEVLIQEDLAPQRIVHAWSVTPDGPLPLAEARLRSFDSLLCLAQALERAGMGHTLQLDVLSSSLQRVAGEKRLFPEKALLLGPVTVLPLEYPHIACRSIDLPTPAQEETCLEELTEDILQELLGDGGENIVAYRDGQRWVRAFAPLTLNQPAGTPSRLRPQGVYLITGGLGGIGLTLARQLAKSVQARLVLTGRSVDPQASRLHASSIRQLEEAGAQVLALTADVADRKAMQQVLSKARDRFGELHGVIHAAGVAGGGISGLKKLEEAHKVLAPKLEGTLLLHSLLEGRPLDFFLICSSITALAGGFGQIDYTAANAFCDAFSHSQARRKDAWVASVNWDRWEEVGMAARSSAAFGFSAAPSSASAHPLLEARLVETPQRSVFSTLFRPDRHWVLSEHRIAGRPTVPGATYLEMARAAFSALHPDSPQAVQIREAVFLTPLSTDPEGQCEALTMLDKKDAGFEFRVVSRTGGGKEEESWQEHARGRIEALPDSHPHPSPRNLDELRRACSKSSITARQNSGNGQEDFLVTGARWQSLRRIEVGEDQALAVLELDESLADDLKSLPLHPALLDIAAGSVRFFSRGDYLPLAYESLRYYAPLPQRGFSHIRLRGAAQSREVISCDASLLDSQGAVCAEIEGFSMKRVGREALEQLRRSAEQTQGELPEKRPPGILPQQGAQALERILARGALPQVVVSPRSPQAAIQEARSWNRSRILEELARMAPSRPAQARPDVSSDYAAPTDDFESRIAAIWQKVLGLERVGANDNFFELGGTSLSGVQLVSELKQELGLEIPTVSIFEAPTVSALARYLRPDKKQPSLMERGRQRAAKKKQVIERKRRARKI